MVVQQCQLRDRKYMAQVDLLVIGDVFYDVTTKLPSAFKSLIQNGTSYATNMVIAPGGSGNIAVCFSRLGGTAAFAGIVGNDLFGKLYVMDLMANEILPVIFKDESSPTGLLTCYVRSDGQRSFLVFRGANDNLKPEYIEQTFGKVKPKLVYITGYSLINKPMKDALLRAARLAAERKIKVLFDPASYNLITINRKYFEDVTKTVDCICLNVEEARALTGEKRISSIVKNLSTKVKMVALKLGNKGCLIVDENNEIRLPAPKVRAIDTTGAGDCFVAGLAFGIAKQLSLEQTAKLALQVSALKVQQIGPRIYSSTLPINDNRSPFQKIN